uniref:Muscle M-line assembly protein unc-89 n=1 Tax=Soboliphyme baturini TaxID=241478 RepID=A0A183ILB8_9BILA
LLQNNIKFKLAKSLFSFIDTDDGPPRKRAKTPPSISCASSVQSLYSESFDFTPGTLEMQGSKITKTQYGYRTLHDTSAKMSLKVTGYPLPVITWFKDGQLLEEDERHKFYSDEDGFFAMTIDPVLESDTGRYTCVATNEYGQATTSAFFRVVRAERDPEPPRFLTKLQDLEVKEGESISVHCEVEGWPEPNIEIYFGGQLILPSHDLNVEYDGRNVTLTIKNVQMQDAGEYVIKLKNSSGEVEHAVRINIEENPDLRKSEPKFQLVIENATVTEEDDVRFKVICTGDPEPDVSWFSNGTLLTNSEKVNIHGEDGIYYLDIKNVSSHFDGEISCAAINRIGECRCTAHLQVVKQNCAPTFELEVCDQAVAVGDTAKFQVYIDAKPEPAVTWTLNGKPANDVPDVEISSKVAAGCYTLEIHNASVEQSGEIVCTASNELGEAASSGRLLVRPGRMAPLFKEKLHDTCVSLGDAVSLQVVIEALPLAHVEWSVNGKYVKDEDVSRFRKITRENGVYVLEILKVEEDTSGNVTCTAENSLGHSSCECLLSLKEEVEFFKTKLPEQSQMTEGSKAIFTVSFAAEQVLRPGKWRINGKLLKPSKSVKITDSECTSTLEIYPISSMFNGDVSYECETESGLSKTSTEVKVLEPAEPTFSSPLPLSTYGHLGESLVLETVASVSLSNEVHWFLNEKEIIDSGAFRMFSDGKGKYSLEIKSFKKEFCGEISCMVKNAVGKVSCKTLVSLPKEEVMPEIALPLQSIEVLEGETAKLEVNINEAAECEAQWKINGVKCEAMPECKTKENERGSYSLEISPVSEKHNGTVEVTLFNKAGRVSSNCSLTVKPKTPPRKPEFLTSLSSVSLFEGDSLKFKLKIVGQPKPEVKWYINNRLIVSAEDVTLTYDSEECGMDIADVCTEMNGCIKCVATNSAGTAETSAMITVNRQIPVEFIQGLEDAVCREGDTLKLTAVLIGAPTPDVTWYINGRQLTESKNVQIKKEQTTYTAVVQDITLDYSGEIICIAKNEYGEARSSSKLTVTPKGIPPDFIEWINNLAAMEGDCVTQKVKFTGDPCPTIVWYLNGEIIGNSDNFSIATDESTSTLIIKRFNSKCVGELVCKAENEAGEVSCTANMQLGSK